MGSRPRRHRKKTAVNAMSGISPDGTHVMHAAQPLIGERGEIGDARGRLRRSGYSTVSAAVTIAATTVMGMPNTNR